MNPTFDSAGSLPACSNANLVESLSGTENLLVGIHRVTASRTLWGRHCFEHLAYKISDRFVSDVLNAPLENESSIDMREMRAISPTAAPDATGCSKLIVCPLLSAKD
jgi:hypothetical protein